MPTVRVRPERSGGYLLQGNEACVEGAVARGSGVVSRAALEVAIRERAPAGSQGVNQDALALGWELGASQVERTVG